MYDTEPDCEASENVVIRMSRSVPRNIGYKVFYDNYFTGVDLQVYLAKNGIHSVRTVRFNKLPSCTLMTKAQLKKEGRGAIDEKTVVVDGIHLSAVRWHDNKAVTLLSTFAGLEPISEVSRWNNKSKCRETVQCPNVIKVYNRHMGGVDLIDLLIGLYRTRIRSKKWYHRLFFSFSGHDDNKCLAAVPKAREWLKVKTYNAS